MIDGKRVLAIIPARSGSKGLPGKNIRPMNGKPLLAWPVEAARTSVLIDEVIISTDNAEFAAIAAAHGARVPFLRPAELASDTAASIDFIIHALDALEAIGERYDYLVLLEPTSPLTETADVDAALQRLHAAADTADSIVGVSEMITSHPAYAVRVDGQGLASPYLSDGFDKLPRRQDLEPLFCLDGSLYISTVEALRRERGFCHGRTLAFEMAHYKSFEVDDLVDFICIEAVSRHLNQLSTDAGGKGPQGKR